MDSKFVQKIIRNAADEIAAKTAHLVNGSAKSYEEYREMVGVIRGLTSTMEYTQALLRSYNKGDDDE